MDNNITALRVQKARDTGTLRRRRDQVLCLETPGGCVYLKKSTLEEAGGSWERLLSMSKAAAQKHGVAFTDETEEA